MGLGHLAGRHNFRLTHEPLVLVAYGHDVAATWSRGLKPLIRVGPMAGRVIAPKAGKDLHVAGTSRFLGLLLHRAAFQRLAGLLGLFAKIGLLGLFANVGLFDVFAKDGLLFLILALPP